MYDRKRSKHDSESDQCGSKQNIKTKKLQINTKNGGGAKEDKGN